MNAALETLFYPFALQMIAAPERGARVQFINAQYHPALRDLSGGNFALQQYFKPYATALQDQGFSVSSTIDVHAADAFDDAFLLLPKNTVEAHFMLAATARGLKNGGRILVAADNKAGGNRLEKMLQFFGFEGVESTSKNKARVAWGRKENLDNDAVKTAIEAGLEQYVLQEKYRSMPGIFGWDKIDRGSEILLQYLPNDLSGRGADFGCGYGYLSRHIVQHLSGVKELSCIDADYRAVEMCSKNLADARIPVRYFWEDLTRSGALSDLDFVVMNPPFHEGKKTDSDIGKAFIENAYKALRPNGVLWMVANAQLPYEDILLQHFERCDKKFEGNGFKVFCATKERRKAR